MVIDTHGVHSASEHQSSGIISETVVVRIFPPGNQFISCISCRDICSAMQ